MLPQSSPAPSSLGRATCGFRCPAPDEGLDVSHVPDPCLTDYLLSLTHPHSSARNREMQGEEVPAKLSLPRQRTRPVLSSLQEYVYLFPFASALAISLFDLRLQTGSCFVGGMRVEHGQELNQGCMFCKCNVSRSPLSLSLPRSPCFTDNGISPTGRKHEVRASGSRADLSSPLLS